MKANHLSAFIGPIERHLSLLLWVSLFGLFASLTIGGWLLGARKPHAPFWTLPVCFALVGVLQFCAIVLLSDFQRATGQSITKAIPLAALPLLLLSGAIALFCFLEFAKIVEGSETSSTFPPGTADAFIGFLSWFLSLHVAVFWGAHKRRAAHR